MDFKIFVLHSPFLFIFLLGNVRGQWQQELIRQRDPRVFSHVEMLDIENKYQLEWVVNWSQKRITFNLTVETKGFVMFGLSQNGDMKGADLIIGGVTSNGKSYFTDRFGVGNQSEPIVDSSQDWQLHSARETRTHTILSFSRAFDTCDKAHDYTITEFDRISLIWGYGQSDRLPIMNRYSARGSFHVYLLDPNIVPRSIKEATFNRGPPPDAILAKENLKLFTVSTSTLVPETDILYQCTIHRGLRSTRKQHVVGIRTRLETAAARRHVHHLDLYRCVPPEGSDATEFFEKFVNLPGEPCYFPATPLGVIPTQYCTAYSFGYVLGARIAFFPDHVGQPIAESPDEYYLVQVHYDNADRLPSVPIDVHVDMYYTDRLRPNEIGIMTIGQDVPAATSILIPPNTPNERLVGHCGSTCTDAMLPDEGIDLFMMFMHTHLSGRRVQVRHIRGNVELPWLNSDSNYDSTYQELRLLKNEATLRKGDRLMMECDMDSTWTNGTVNGGFTTRHEMCLSYIWYYNRLPEYAVCMSEIRDQRYMKHYLLGLQNVTWSYDNLDFVATSPSYLEGMTIREISDMVEWTKELRSELQHDHMNLPQINLCTGVAAGPLIWGAAGDAVGIFSSGSGLTTEVTYPRGIKEWHPPVDNTCAASRVARRGSSRSRLSG